MSESNSSNRWFGIAMVLIGLIVGYGLAIGINSSPGSVAPKAGDIAPTADAPTPAPMPEVGEVSAPNADVDNIQGSAGATISIIEYSDLECPFCARHHPTVEGLLEKYGDDVNWVFRHFPLSFHQNAQKGAEGVQCARAQGGNDAAWDFIDAVFEKGADNASYARYAEDIGLNKEEFQGCIDDGTYADYVQTDMTGGTVAGIRGTPGNIIYNNETGEAELVSGAQPSAAFEAVIDTMLDK